uniref:Secreted protein n=1 Tax=Setaria viridis TaxID=4556 RepID=A0A4U6U4Y9_SETVI|nr:hypothetical protein SEVIR_6G093700v2 [Setaria viridis]TKW09426.1 hypothetical protein SEVIR_6G093700v2 [Setaria viridis]
MKTCMVLFLSWKTLNLCMASKILSLILVSPGRSPFLDPPLAWRKGEQEEFLRNYITQWRYLCWQPGSNSIMCSIRYLY